MVENLISVVQANPVASQRYSEPRCELWEVVKVAGVAWKWLTSVAVHSGPRQARHRENPRRDYVGLLVRSDLPLESSQVTQTPGPAKVHGLQDWAISAWMPEAAEPFWPVVCDVLTAVHHPCLPHQDLPSVGGPVGCGRICKLR